MKIDALNNSGLNGAGRVTPKATPTSASSPASAGTEGVRLSSASAALAAQEPEVNLARVQEIRKAISEGKFEINASAIADRLISTARELIVARRQT